jgi:FkbM family methyltransferase
MLIRIGKEKKDHLSINSSSIPSVCHPKAIIECVSFNSLRLYGANMQRGINIEGKKLSFTGVSESDRYFLSINDNFGHRFQEFCRVYLQNDYVALDIGANIGVTTCILSHFLNKGKIYSFEPGKKCFNALVKNIAANNIKNVVAHNVAVNETSCPIGFSENSAWGHVNTSALDKQIDSYSIDDFVARFNIENVDFMKIDVEGFESHVFRGAINTLNRFNPIIHFEFNSFCLMSFGKASPLEFMQFITDNFKYIFRVKAPCCGISIRACGSCWWPRR